MSANRDVRRREMPGGRGEDERTMFAEELIAMRNQRGLAQEETAAKMLVSASAIANIESGIGEAAGRGVCADRDELGEWLSFGDWSNGSAFAIEGTPEADGRVITLCFVQQGECTDEWLVIKSWPRVGGTWMHLASESISWHYILHRRANGAAHYEDLLCGLLAVTPEQCRTYSY